MRLNPTKLKNIVTRHTAHPVVVFVVFSIRIFHPPVETKGYPAAHRGMVASWVQLAAQLPLTTADESDGEQGVAEVHGPKDTDAGKLTV